MSHFKGVQEFDKRGLVAFIITKRLGDMKPTSTQNRQTIHELIKMLSEEIAKTTDLTRADLVKIATSEKSELESWGSYSRFAKDFFDDYRGLERAIEVDSKG